MVQHRDGAGFALEARAPVWIACYVTANDLHGDAAMQGDVFCFVDFAHTSGAKGAMDDVMPQRTASVKWLRSVSDHAAP
jgi:hypothetical protein